MAVSTNPNKPAGLAPIGTLTGADWTGKGRMYCIPSSDSTYNYMQGDLVSLTGAADPATGLACISLTAAGSAAVGVIQAVGIYPSGPLIDPNNLQRTYAPVTKQQSYYAYVLDSPDVIYEIQEGGTGNNLSATASAGLNANILLNTAVTTGVPPSQLISGTTLTNNSAPTTTSTLNLKIISLAQRIDNSFITSPSTNGYQKWWVIINNHQYRGGVTAP